MDSSLFNLNTLGKVTASETQRLITDCQRETFWKLWGPYLSERQWGTVREDYSADGNAWTYFPHDMARLRAYRWGEDGLLGWTDRFCRLCFSPVLWNGRDPILKERLFGLAGPQGNHGEDVKELYYYLDSTPTHSYCKALYKYPQAEFPYKRLVEENARRSRAQEEFELLDTGIFDNKRYFDVFVEYAKNTFEDILIRINIWNRGPEAATIHVLPSLWFRNTWSWGKIQEEVTSRPDIRLLSDGRLLAEHLTLGAYCFASETVHGEAGPEILFTENDTNQLACFGVPNPSPYVKDAFHRYVIHGEKKAVNPAHHGTKAAIHHVMEVPAGGMVTIRCRLCAESSWPSDPFADFHTIFEERIREADEFYAQRIGQHLTAEKKNIARQAYAGLFWSKQFYYFVQPEWQKGDPAQPPPPPSRASIRNADWAHLFSRDVLSMPDKWEYPYFCTWDLAFHTVSYANVDPIFAKEQLSLFLREWYMHPNGQLPAYEWDFSDVNPPVHPWAAWRVYRLPWLRGVRDHDFLESVFQKLLLNFTWWVNRKDPEGNNLFAGGFLGLDNVGVFDRSKPLPTGGTLHQADGTAWMAFYCIHMFSIALELAQRDPVYEDMASKFFEHFVRIAHAINEFGGTGLWNEEDGFYYDQLEVNGETIPLKVRSIVGFIPLFATTLIPKGYVSKLTGFQKRLKWFIEHRPLLTRHVIELNPDAADCARLLAIPSKTHLSRILRLMFDENEFLSPYGIRSVSKYHEKNPYIYRVNGNAYSVDYEPGEGRTGMFGGNSNWRGPVWFPVNYLIIESLRTYHRFYGENLKVEFPTGSDDWVTLGEAARRLTERLISIFLPDKNGRRPCHGHAAIYAEDPHWRDLVLFNEYFHADTGRGCGASHQTGWTALVTDLLSLEQHWDF